MHERNYFPIAIRDCIHWKTRRYYISCNWIMQCFTSLTILISNNYTLSWIIAASIFKSPLLNDFKKSKYSFKVNIGIRTFSKAVTSSKFSLIRFRWSCVSSHRWSSWYHRTFRSQIVRPSQITYPIRIQQTTRFAKKSNWICERKLSKWCDNESIQATLFSFKNAGICYTRFIFSANHCRLLNLWVKWKSRGALNFELV